MFIFKVFSGCNSLWNIWLKALTCFLKELSWKKKQTNKLSQIFRFILFLLKEEIPKYETSVICAVFFYPLHTRWKLNVPMTFRRRPGRPIYVMSPSGKFRLYCACEMFSWHDFISSKFHVNVRYPEVVVRRYSLLKKHVLAQVFSCEFCKISKNTYFHRTPLGAASEST